MGFNPATEPIGRFRITPIVGRRITVVIIVFIGLLVIKDSFRRNLTPIFSASSPGKNKTSPDNILIGKNGSAEVRHEEEQQISPKPVTGFQLPKVALLFLTRGPMPLESIWKDFLGVDPINGNNDPTKSIAWQTHFSIHVHAPPGFTYPSESLFHDHTIKRPTQAQWGKHSMIDAERKLLQAGLEDPLNKYFVLLSETHIPLYSAAATYLTLATEKYSRIRACGNSSDESDIRRRMTYRMSPEMNESGITEHTWRKSSQWFGLIRSHAELVVQESVVDNAFKRYCYVEQKTKKEEYDSFCASDEHYIPTMLAINKKEAECACDGHMTRVVWTGPFRHPKTFGKGDATMATLRHELRGEGECTEGPRLESVADEILEEIDNTIVVVSAPVVEGDDMLKNILSRAKVPTLKQKCPLFARKIDKDAEPEWRELLKVFLCYRLPYQGDVVSSFSSSGL